MEHNYAAYQTSVFVCCLYRRSSGTNTFLLLLNAFHHGAEQNAEYEVIDDSQEHWWKVKDQHGTVGYIPSNYVKAKELLGLDKYE